MRPLHQFFRLRSSALEAEAAEAMQFGVSGGRDLRVSRHINTVHAYSFDASQNEKNHMVKNLVNQAEKLVRSDYLRKPEGLLHLLTSSKR
jgi:hypothetical protein